MLIGYARTATLDQKAGLEAQMGELQAAGCDRLFEEQVSSVDVAARQKLADALDFIREGTEGITVGPSTTLAALEGQLEQLVTKLPGKY